LTQADDSWVLDCVRMAVQAGRPGLAGRAVGLVGGQNLDDPDVLKARRAARMLCIERPLSWQADLDELLQGLRKQLMRRAKTRARRQLKQPNRVGVHPSKRTRKR
jgi:hypothetical protein